MTVSSPSDTLQHHLQAFAQLSETDIRLADGRWHISTMRKQNTFNFRHSVC